MITGQLLSMSIRATSWLTTFYLIEVQQLMMHATTRAMFLDSRRGLLFARGLGVRYSRRFRVLFLALGVLLGSTSLLQAATATWNANPEPDIAGYILSYGTSPGVHPTSVDVKNVLTWQLTTLTPGTTYFFVLQAYNTSALTSVDSVEVPFTVPVVTPPSLTSLTPTSGAVGTSVTIAGTNLGASQGTSTVTFNGTAAAPTSWGATSIVVPVPAAATTGMVVVTVGGAASNGITFTVTVPAPTLTSLNPTSGAIGTPVTIAGANFGAAQGTSTVLFNGTAATPTSWSATSIVVPVPGATTTGSVVVTVGGVASNGISFTVNASAPSLTSLNPTSGAAGTPVTIAGANFGTSQGASIVRFNGIATTPLSWSAASIVAPVPGGATTGAVVVTVGGVASNGISFTVTVPAPSLTSLTPTSGGVGTPVTVAGANFGATQGSSTVTFNGTAATPTSWSASSIVVPVPSAATTGTLIVMVGGTASNGISFSVTVPSLTSLSPSSGAVGTSVTIAGANFAPTQGSSTVKFNGTTATPTSWSGTSIIVPVPGAATTGPVVVTVGGVASNGLSFTVVPSSGVITLTQHGSIDAGGTSVALAFASNNAAGNFIAVAVRAFSANQTITVSDSRGNVYLQAFKANNNTDDTLALFYAQNIAAGANTVTVAVSTSDSIRFAILEYAGVATSNALDVTATNTGSSTSPASGNKTTTAAGDLLIGVFATQSLGTFTAGSGYTMEEAVSAAPSTALMIDDATQAAAGTASATATLAASDLWGAGLAAFRKGGSVNTPPTLTQPANQTSAANTGVSLALVGSDPDGDTLTYSATGLPPVVTVNAATGLISGTLTTTSAGTYTVIATVSDGSLTNSKTFSWTVTTMNLPPTLTQPPNRTSARNATVSLQLVGSDPDGDTLTYSATGLPAPLTVNAATGRISGTFVAASVGVHTVTATVSDGTVSASQTFTWTVRNATPALSAVDFDGDGKTDVVVYRPSVGSWYVLYSSTNYTTSNIYQWGISTDVTVPGDYDGDGKTDLAIYRPSTATWFILSSSTNYTTFNAYQWGAANSDLPVPGDYDGDGKTDLVVYRPSTSIFFVLNSSTNYTTSSIHQLGASGDIPVTGDYDGDGKTDPAVYRASTGTFFVLNSSTNYTTMNAYQWGASTDVPVPGDYDGDGKIDVAVYRPSTATWYILNSSTNYTTFNIYQWGAGGGDTPVPGDYDGDGRTDLAVYRPSTATWYVLKSSTNYTLSNVYQWGGANDVPVRGRP